MDFIPNNFSQIELYVGQRLYWTTQLCSSVDDCSLVLFYTEPKCKLMTKNSQ